MACAMQDSYEGGVKSLQNQLNIARNEINNLRQQVKSLTHAHRKDCEEIQRKLENWKCLECRSRQLQLGGIEHIPNVHRNVDLPLRYIGTIHTQFPEKRGTPRQPGICADLIAKITLDNDVLTNPDHALEGLQEFSHMWILFHFHRNDSTHVRAKVAPPRLNGIRTGVFATRSPHRPCPIGLSLVKVDRIMENTIYFSGVDMVDQTPVLDIKPYIPQYDNPALLVPTPHTAIMDNACSLPDASLCLKYANSDRPIGLAEALSESLSNVNINSRVLDGEEENRGRDLIGASDRSTAHSNLEVGFHLRSASRFGEREAPDGEEDEEEPLRPTAGPSTSSNTASAGLVRIPSWIDQARARQLRVQIKDSVLIQLNQFGYSVEEADERIATITNVLREDPRSVFLRDKIGNNCYVFRIASLYVSCKFSDFEQTVIVFKISQMSETLE